MPRTLPTVVVLLICVATVGPAAASVSGPTADIGGTVFATPATPDAAATHTVSITVDEPLQGASRLAVRYGNSGTDVSNVRSTDVIAAGVDQGGDDPGGQVDVDLSSDVSVEVTNNGTGLRFSFARGAAVGTGDEMVVSYRGVTNPGAGTHPVELALDPLTANRRGTGQLQIVDRSGPAGPVASLTVSNQTSDGTELTIDRVNLPRGGYLVARSMTNGTPGRVVGVTSLLDPGSDENVPFLLDRPLSVTGPVAVTAYVDVGERPGESPEDEPYVTGDGPVRSTATVTVIGQASVQLRNQTTTGGNVTVASASLSTGGYLVVHRGGPDGGVIGHSSYLSADEYGSLRIALDERLEATGTIAVVAHHDTDGDRAFEFPGEDSPYTTDGLPAADRATLTVEPQATPTPTPTPTSGGGAGFGPVAAVLALLASAVAVWARPDV